MVVLTQLPLKSVLRSADYTGRIAKWSTILGAFDIKYMPRTSMKGQVLADLVAEFAKPSIEDNDKELDMDEKSVGMILCKEPTTQKVYVDEAANQRGSGVGLVLVSPEGLMFKKSLRLGFSATNNEVEYEALLVGMDMVQKMGGKSVQIFSDSQLVVGQVEGTLEARDPRMQEYLTQARSMNTHVDSLATLATSSAQILPRVILVEDLFKPSGMSVDTIWVQQIRFDSKAFRRYCGDLGIMNRYFTPAYPQGNEQAEAVNKVIVSGLKKRLDDSKGMWVEEYRTFCGRIELRIKDPLERRLSL
ncbi:uncharacterized protein LOC142644208 [Castanea sativa]|uniref:uncharacterized protein LOC142644208 n=1 Tax=Castanea sativa TaxID=21020 RepID=UPI003F64F934